MKTVYSYQEIGTLIDQRKEVMFTCYPIARVTAVQRHPDLETITVTIQLSIRETCVGIMENEYSSILALLEAFDIDDLLEIWEVLDQ
jgi:hypothetical protein